MKYRINWMWAFVSVLSFIVLALEVNDRKNEIYGFFLSPESFSSTNGEIMQAREKMAYKSVREYDIRYVFRLGSSVYDSGVIDFTGRYSEVEKYLAKYPKGEKVKVFYQTDNPWVSALEPTEKSYYLFLSPVFLVTLFVYSVVSAIKQRV